VRIAFITESWHPNIDGIVTRLDHTVTHLVAAGHEVLVIAPTVGDPIQGVIQHQTRNIRLPTDRNHRWALPDRSIDAALDEFQPAVVHAVNPILMGADALRRAARRYRVVASFHTDVKAYLGGYGFGWARPLLRAIERATYRRADARLVTSPTGRERLRELGLNDATLWPAAVDRAVFGRHRDGSRLRGSLNPEPDLPLALCVGRLAREKGCQRLLAAATGPEPVHVTFVGEGPDSARLRRVFRGAHASFVGMLDRETLADAYAAADILLFPSNTDTVGLVLLEAMATGLPVVAVDTPAARHTLCGYARAACVPSDASQSAWTKAIIIARTASHGGDGRSLAGHAGAAPAEQADAEGWGEATELLLRCYADLQLGDLGRWGPPVTA
jgi:glycosyltransferase involved in cell wall biosynthesis